MLVVHCWIRGYLGLHRSWTLLAISPSLTMHPNLIPYLCNRHRTERRLSVLNCLAILVGLERSRFVWVQSYSCPAL